jgi:hypothetical protein
MIGTRSGSSRGTRVSPCSIGQRGAVGSHFARCTVDELSPVHAMFDALVAAEPAVGLAHRPAETDEFASCIRGYATLEAQQPFWAVAWCVFTHALRGALVVIARAVSCGLSEDRADSETCLRHKGRLAVLFRVVWVHFDFHTGLNFGVTNSSGYTLECPGHPISRAAVLYRPPQLDRRKSRHTDEALISCEQRQLPHQLQKPFLASVSLEIRRACYLYSETCPIGVCNASATVARVV